MTPVLASLFVRLQLKVLHTHAHVHVRSLSRKFLLMPALINIEWWREIWGKARRHSEHSVGGLLPLMEEEEDEEEEESSSDGCGCWEEGKGRNQWEHGWLMEGRWREEDATWKHTTVSEWMSKDGARLNKEAVMLLGSLIRLKRNGPLWFVTESSAARSENIQWESWNPCDCNKLSGSPLKNFAQAPGGKTANVMHGSEREEEEEEKERWRDWEPAAFPYWNQPVWAEEQSSNCKLNRISWI